MKHLKRRTAAVVVTAALCAPAFAAGDRSVSEKFDDAWIDGSVETALLLNTHLNSFKIDTDVRNGVVTLTGTVDSDIDRDLAGEIAKGVDGVQQVDNRLVVGKTEPSMTDKAEAEARDFGQWARDATTTAEIKTRLLANKHTEGLKIDVTTQSDVVTLTGTVGSDEEAQLAAKIAENVDGVAEVRNELAVSRVASK